VKASIAITEANMIVKNFSQLYTLMHQSHKNKSRTQIQT